MRRRALQAATGHRALLVCALWSLPVPAAAQQGAPADPVAGAAQRAEAEVAARRLSWVLVPATDYNSDDGLGLGALTALYWLDGTTEPYRHALIAQLKTSTRWRHDHWLRYDTLDVGGWPLRLWGELGYGSTVNRPYCGLGDLADCDRAHARAAARAFAYDAETRSQVEERFYQLRVMMPYLVINGRYEVRALPRRTELFAGWRGTYYLPGEPGAAGPYPGSLYERHFAGGEEGFASVLQAGAMLDARDNEPAPTRGYWVEASLRGAAPWWGSRWSFAGANVTLRGYLPLTRVRDLVLAGRLVLDALLGDPPVIELARVGGSRDLEGFGGGDLGRGVRRARYVGRLKAVWQTELRWTFAHLRILDTPLDLGTVGFLDAGAVGLDYSAEGAPRRALWSAGGGLRGAWDRNFIVRLDVGGSPFEEQAPGVYLSLDHLF